MTVKELREMIASLPDDLPVLVDHYNYGNGGYVPPDAEVVDVWPDKKTMPGSRAVFTDYLEPHLRPDAPKPTPALLLR